jgi:hypothetical protein
MHLGVTSVTADLVRETAYEQGDAFEGDQSYPVMGVRHIKLEQGLSEEVIETCHGQQRHNTRFKKAPLQGNGGYEKEMNRSRRGEIEVKSIGDPGDEQRCQDADGDPDGSVANCFFMHSPATNKRKILASNP